MPGDAAAYGDSKRSELRVPDPDARLAVAAMGGYLECGDAGDERLLDAADVAGDVEAKLPERNDRIADKLTGSVVGGAPPALSATKVDPLPGELLQRNLEVLELAATADRHDRVVLKEQEGRWPDAGNHFVAELNLEGMGVVVRLAPEPTDFEGIGG
jgi:hypothetical protein